MAEEYKVGDVVLVYCSKHCSNGRCWANKPTICRIDEMYDDNARFVNVDNTWKKVIPRCSDGSEGFFCVSKNNIITKV